MIDEGREGIADVRERLAAIRDAVKDADVSPLGLALETDELDRFIRDELEDVERWVAMLRHEAIEREKADDKAETLRESAAHFADLIDRGIGPCLDDEPIELHAIRMALYRFRETNT